MIEDLERNVIGFQLFHLPTGRGGRYAEPALVCGRVLAGWSHWVGDSSKIDPLPSFSRRFSKGISVKGGIDCVEVSLQH